MCVVVVVTVVVVVVVVCVCVCVYGVSPLYYPGDLSQNMTLIPMTAKAAAKQTTDQGPYAADRGSETWSHYFQW